MPDGAGIEIEESEQDFADDAAADGPEAIAPTADVTLTFQTIHAGTATTVGTMTISSGMTTGSYTVASGFTLPAGDRLRLYAPAGVNTHIAGAFGTIYATR